VSRASAIFWTAKPASPPKQLTLQNRVTPFGEVVAIPQRGLFTGNRGIIHDPATKTLLPKRWATKAWIICSCSYKGAHRDPMATRSWTELFFLDEAVALAAGHRPCFLCRREAALAFQAAWSRATGDATPKVARMDGALHGERLNGRAKRLHPYSGDKPIFRTARSSPPVELLSSSPADELLPGTRPATTRPGRTSRLTGLLRHPQRSAHSAPAIMRFFTR
jgi:hypothetical protein